MTPAELAAFQDVYRQCNADMNRLCEPKIVMSESEQHLLQDPFASFFSPSHAIVTDFSTVMDEFINSAPILRTYSSTEDGGLLVTMESIAPPSFGMEEMDRAVNDILSQLAISTPRSHSMEDVHKQMVQYSQHLLEQPDVTEDKVRVARRLMEVPPEDLHRERQQVSHFLPYADDAPNSNSRCLMNAFENDALSRGCNAAVDKLQLVRWNLYQEKVFAEQVEQFMLVLMLCLCTLLIVLRRRRPKRNNRRLKVRIMRAVYSQPQLKQQVEQLLGEPLGALPPLAPRVLGRFFGSRNKVHRKRSNIFTLLFLVSLLLFPVIMLLVLSVVALARLFARRSRVDDCCTTCCCCGATTDDVAAGTLTEEQACCCCCNGTAICAPSSSNNDDGGCCCCGDDCASCCSATEPNMEDGDVGCCCCGDDCACCSTESCGVTTRVQPLCDDERFSRLTGRPFRPPGAVAVLPLEPVLSGTGGGRCSSSRSRLRSSS